MKFIWQLLVNSSCKAQKKYVHDKKKKKKVKQNKNVQEDDIKMTSQCDRKNYFPSLCREKKKTNHLFVVSF